MKQIAIILLTLAMLAAPALAADVIPVQETLSLDTCQSATGWSELNNDTDNLATNANHVRGLYALAFDKVNGAGNKVYCGIYKTLSRLNVTSYVESGGYIHMALYIPATTNLDYAYVKLGTSSAVYSTFRVEDAVLAVGWNVIRFPLAAPYSVTGVGMNTADVRYLEVGIGHDLETNTQAGYILGMVALKRGMGTTTDLASESTFVGSSGSLQVNIVEQDAAAIAVSATGAVNAIDNPIFISSDVGIMDANPTATNVLTIGAVSAQYTLPTNGGRYQMTAAGSSAWCTCDTNPTATVGGKGFFLPEGEPFPAGRIAEDKCACITSGGAGSVVFLELD